MRLSGRPAPAPAPAPASVASRRRRGGRRRAVLERVGPLATAAAVVLALVLAAGSPSADTQDPTAMTSAVSAQADLSRLAASGAVASELRVAALHLNDEVEQMVAQSGGDPDAAELAVLMLDQSASLLTGSAQRSQLTDVLAAALALRTRLQLTLPVTGPTPQVVTVPKGTPPRRSPVPASTAAGGARPSTPPGQPGPQPNPSSRSTASASPGRPSAAPTPTDPAPRASLDPLGGVVR